MIAFTEFELSNGLKVIHHFDDTTHLCVLNVLYNVGSKLEDPEKTGFAHLFEHLMFGGSIHIPEYDAPLQFAGGENNAFTSNDITNYYLTLPANNIETGFWLESDRMLGLAFNQKSLDIQKNVVIEEYKERYLNPPYGDVWLHLLPLAYSKHPYRWPTIGKDVSHIENAVLADVEDFFNKFYNPNNAILVVSGNIDLSKTKELAEKWFGPIPKGDIPARIYDHEPPQTEPRFKTIHADVPANMIVMAFHSPARLSPNYYAIDLVSDILGAGKSARLYTELVKEKRLFAEIDCYLTGDMDPGLFVIEGKLASGIPLDIAEKAIRTILDEVSKNGVKEIELQKVKNKVETTIRFNDIGVLNKAMKLANSCLLGNTNLINEEIAFYEMVSMDEIQDAVNQVLSASNCSTLYYLSKQNGGVQ